MDEFHQATRELGEAVTLPITAGVLGRNPDKARELASQGVEFAVHGYEHWDYSGLPESDQERSLRNSLNVFREKGVPVSGFRAPYLRTNESTVRALRNCGFEYDASAAIHWAIGSRLESPTYLKSLDFYGSRCWKDHPSLPTLAGGLVRIPYSLPDDESIIERLRISGPDEIYEVWLSILEQTHQLGELFVLGNHPERFGHCSAALVRVVETARALDPPVWIANLKRISDWWRNRALARVDLTELGAGQLRVVISGPRDVSVLIRGTNPETPTVRWTYEYKRCLENTIILESKWRPWIGVSPSTPAEIVNMLRQHGYIVEVSTESSGYSVYLYVENLSTADSRRIMAGIESTRKPFLKLNKWPGDARSALAITGDIDALTLFDYLFRFLPVSFS